MFKRKDVEAPATNITFPIVAVKLWIVTWHSRKGPYSGDLEKEFEAFPVKEDAEHFAESLRAAYKLLRHTSKTDVDLYTKE